RRHTQYEWPRPEIATPAPKPDGISRGTGDKKHPRPGREGVVKPRDKEGRKAARRYSCSESSGPWSTGVDRMIWVQVLPSFWNWRISCSSCIMLPQLTLIRKVYSPVTW